MSDPKRISPLLDGFTMGGPMSDHDGVSCCPAIKENTDKKYIVKIISIPASQVQMDALLLAGAYKDPADAMDYFREVAEGVMKEAELLKRLSKLDGFLPYEGWQMEPITKRRLGYEVYLLGSYKRSLDKYVRRNPVTQLEAVNLGLDLCSALSVCRSAGALYVDLKPTNIFMSDKKEYRISDLGFVELDALKYTALPDKYRSVYTPPELHDPMATLNLTADTYAVGMILYQLYNDGQLPFRDKAPEEVLPPPLNADYELAEIIMKAIHPDPQQRWSDPKEMGHALVDYMQRNTVNDVPITPHTPLEVDPEDVVFFQKRAEAEQADISPSQGSKETPAGEDEAKAPPVPEPPADETEPDEADAETLMPHEMSDELSRIMAKADDLLSHETPEGVVLPEIPDPPDPFAFIKDDLEDPDDSGIPVDPVMEEPPDPAGKRKKKKEKKFVSPDGKRRAKKLLSAAVTILILAAVGFGVFWFYQNEYLQTIRGLSVVGDRNQLSVTVDTEVSHELLHITCSDNYGNVETKDLAEGQVVFTGLRPNTMYTLRVEIDGFHKLVGQTSEIFTTDTTTSIVTFSAVTGAEDGSVMLNFTADGDEPDQWTLVYSAEGEQEQRQSFTGHSVSVSGLSVGKIYTFTLDAGEDLSLSGKTSLEYMASRLILAQNLTIASTGSNDMTIRWNAPGDIVVDSWSVRCYSESGYEQQLTVNNTEVYLSGIDPTVSYTVEVTAAGMTQPARTSITANPINVTAAAVDSGSPRQLNMSWDYTGNPPDGGWLLMYSIDGSDSKNVIKCAEPSAVITPKVPGAKYRFTIQAADATSIFNNVQTYPCPDAADFEGNGLTAENITGQLVKTPENQGWTYESLSSDAHTDQFAPGERISVVLHGSTNFYLPGSEIDILYVIRDSVGNALPELVSEKKGNWKDIWYAADYHYGELDIPTVPTEPGEYSVTVYFDGMKVAAMDFTITE